MPEFVINVVKRGSVKISAPTLDAATQRAVGLPDSAFAWETRDFEDCYPDDGSNS